MISFRLCIFGTRVQPLWQPSWWCAANAGVRASLSRCRHHHPSVGSFPEFCAEAWTGLWRDCRFRGCARSARRAHLRWAFARIFGHTSNQKCEPSNDFKSLILCVLFYLCFFLLFTIKIELLQPRDLSRSIRLEKLHRVDLSRAPEDLWALKLSIFTKTTKYEFIE